MTNSSLFNTGIRPAIDAFLEAKAAEERNYGDYWSASSGGYCMRKLIFQRLGVPPVKPQDARKTRVFEAGHIFHEYMQRITRDAGLSIAQEVELQDEGLMVRGHFDDLVLIKTELDDTVESYGEEVHPTRSNLILYDYKTQNSRAFTYQKGKEMSFYHHMQLGTYMYMIRKIAAVDAGWLKFTGTGDASDLVKQYNALQRQVTELSESRILRISKDDLRQEESQLLWSPALEKEVYEYWSTLNGYWKARKIPKCTCADHEGGFLAREAYNDYFFNDEPCSMDWFNKCKEEGLVKI